jgi:putative tricarboxylic transport membrane protein
MPHDTETSTLPLKGIVVLELGHTVMGPTCGLILGDLGADVYKVERTGKGDDTRWLKGFGSGFFTYFNRNKKSIAIDLKSSKGKELLLTLVQHADVLIENFGPGTVERLGVGYEACRERNPRLIYCALKGFMPGPYEKRPALDEVVQMMGGLAYMTGPSGCPLRAGASVTDIMGGSYGAIGILAALYQRRVTGRGQLVQASLYESVAFMVGQHMAIAAISGEPPPPMPERGRAWSVYDLFDTADGRQVFVGITSDRHWKRFCETFGYDDWQHDPQLSSNAGRIDARDWFLPKLRQRLGQLTQADLMEKSLAAGIPFARVTRPQDLFDDVHLNAASALAKTRLPDGQTAKHRQRNPGTAAKSRSVNAGNRKSGHREHRGCLTARGHGAVQCLPSGGSRRHGMHFNTTQKEEKMNSAWKLSFGKMIIAAVLATGLIAAGSMPAGAFTPEEVHFLIPGGAGGGWDGTARGVGKALMDSGILKNASFENMSGGGGGKALNYLITTAKRQQGTLLVNSTPIIIRSLTGVFPQSFRDLTPIASVIADYAAFVVPKNSKFQTWNDVVASFKKDPKSVKVAGGSVKGGMDHLVAAMAFEAAGGDPLEVVYVPYDAGGKAMAGLLSGDTQILSTGYSEAVGLSKQGEIRILATTAEERLAPTPDVPTLKELGYDTTFANWRGFFGVPGLPEEKAEGYRKMLEKMYDTKEWEEMRTRRGWENLFKPGAEFYTFLENQEKAIGGVMRTLGFIK